MYESKPATCEPWVQVKRLPELSDVEIWDFHNWRRPGSYCMPTLTFSVAATGGISSVVARCGGTRTTASGSSALLIGLPEDLYAVEKVLGSQPAPGELTLIGLSVPICAISSEYWNSCNLRLDSGLLDDSRLSSMCLELAGLVRSVDVALCDKEAHILRFINAAVPAMARVTEDRHAIGGELAVRRTREFIDAHWRRPFSLSEVATEVGLSKWHLTRCFRKKLGISPGEYARSIRGDHALRALRAQTPLAVVAAELGYSDQAHLTREMRRLYGFTPGHYRSATSRAATVELAHRRDRSGSHRSK